ncbi:hypothetical protein ACFE04_011249 [Oxalis oulophora]
MPTSPAAFRYSSPGGRGGMRGEENHKRGRSLEGRLVFKEKDDDLALFNDMHTKEQENFLLQSSDDFEDTFSIKLKNFLDFKRGISITTRGESSELLNVEGDKNDYDWLLTPPETPLFPSLDDEPQLDIAAHRGRPRSKPITISRSSTMEKSYRSSRGSASPNRLTPSPRSENNTFHSRGRQSSATRSSPTPSARSATPTRRSSPPFNKPTTPTPRPSTPNSRRISAGSASPIRTPSRGNSPSPKVKEWQSGFSTDVPPNLRISLADRPASYVRGSSPASSRNGSRVSRQSMSPTASRSVSSSHSHDRDRFSSYSVASSGVDDVDSLTVGSLDRAISKQRVGAVSKKSNKIISPSSAPKRSFDSAYRKMDRHKAPQNMFRPLLSSAPSSTLYAGKLNSVQHTLISRNSSVTTSSTASSDHVVPDTEEVDHHEDDIILSEECRKMEYSIGHEEVFLFDKIDTLIPDVGLARQDSSLDNQLANIESAIACDRDSNLIVASIPYEDLSCVRDSASSLRSSIGHGSTFSSSSVDFGSAKHLFEAQIQRQFSGKKFGGDNYRHDCNNIEPSSVALSSSSGVSNHVRQASGTATSSIENFDVSVDDHLEVITPLVSEAMVNVSENEEINVMDPSINDSDASISEDLSSHVDNFHLEENRMISLSNYEDCDPHEDNEAFPSNVFDGEVLSDGHLNSSLDEDVTLSNSPDNRDVAEELPTYNSLTTISEIGNGCQEGTSDSENDDDNLNLKSNTNESEECSALSHQDPVISDHAHDDFSEDSTVLVKCRGQSKSRSPTFEEATDTLLFCSLIVQDLANKAATIAIEKEKPTPLEITQPTVTILRRSNSLNKDPPPKTAPKRHSKTKKPRHKHVETDTKIPSSKPENDENVNEEPMMRIVGLPKKADDMKPPKLESSRCSNCIIM